MNPEHKLLSKLENIFKTDNRIFTNNKLDYNLLIYYANNYDERVIKTLYNDDETRDIFFKQIDNINIFCLNTLNNSYISSKNWVLGAVNNNDDVLLNFPYKDCILQGGLTKDDIKTNEIFFNKSTSHNQINMLLSEKAFCNFKQYGENTSDKFNDFMRDVNGTIKNNLLIKGDNLLVLHSIKSEFQKKVKLIYIDVPYNTGSDSFDYNDKFKHSTWLLFMKNRLEVARELLSDDGVIFVQCDDNEQAYLKVLMDEIFNIDNFVSNFMWLHGKGKKNKNVRTLQEYALCYAKNINSLESWKQSKSVSGHMSNPDSDERGEWFSGSISFSEERSNKNHKNYYRIKSPSGKFWNRQWLCDKNTMSKYIEDNKIYFGTAPDYNNVPREKIFPNEDKQVIPENILSDLGTTRSANNELNLLFGENVFKNPKPEALMARIIEISTKENDIVLDFCAGSGTTLAVAHKMKRQYIGVEQVSHITDVALERLKKVIAGEQGGVSKNMEWNGGGEFIYFELAKFNNSIKKNILNAKNTAELLSIFNRLNDEFFICYEDATSKLYDEMNNTNSNFHIEDIESQKQKLIFVLNRSQIYVPKSECENIYYKMNKDDINFTNDFYSI